VSFSPSSLAPSIRSTASLAPRWSSYSYSQYEWND
jgi:hypothetical protein